MVGTAGQPRNGNHGWMRVVSVEMKLVEEFITVHQRHGQVAQNDVERLLGHYAERLGPAAGHFDVGT